MKLNHRRETEQVYTVTNAPRPMSQDIEYRQRRYLVSMGVRTGCFIGAVVAAVAGAPFWVAGLMVVGALLLPYISVIFANGGREPTPSARFDDAQGPEQKPISGQRPEIGS
ncbi:hypothetical protein BJF79_32840 [Actinomadura sp. CNU-125]|uniref:DUF3099 domain-containing protein n=1 Tax=Actinomadura sp. CNU-125 TaxID=1904961 RepID=UPI0009695089|nr:DUF3099 domain-containing protein [Actinomadura sp. CNU-125]OLT34807.1 hypothetical protein BJF79_32840 [Actinomadura sp. CNU-125]